MTDLHIQQDELAQIIELDEKNYAISWLARHKQPYMLESLERLAVARKSQIKKSYTDEYKKIMSADSYWDHGFANGSLAITRLVLSISDGYMARDKFPDITCDAHYQPVRLNLQSGITIAADDVAYLETLWEKYETLVAYARKPRNTDSMPEFWHGLTEANIKAVLKFMRDTEEKYPFETALLNGPRKTNLYAHGFNSGVMSMSFLLTLVDEDGQYIFDIDNYPMLDT